MPGLLVLLLVFRIRGTYVRQVVVLVPVTLAVVVAVALPAVVAAVRVVLLLRLVALLLSGDDGGAEGIGCWGCGSSAESSTVIAIRIGRPHWWLSASPMSGASRPSSTPLANSLGTASRAVSATSANGWVRFSQSWSFGLRLSLSARSR